MAVCEMTEEERQAAQDIIDSYQQRIDGCQAEIRGLKQMMAAARVRFGITATPATHEARDVAGGRFFTATQSGRLPHLTGKQ